MLSKIFNEYEEQLDVSFGYQCIGKKEMLSDNSQEDSRNSGMIGKRNSSFSCLSGAALSANTTWANTNICNGLIGAGILPSLDSPKTFQRVPSSPSLSSLDILSSSLQSNMSNLSGNMYSQSDSSEWSSNILKSMSAPSKSDSFLNAMKVEMAGGAAGEDRVQAVCSEENGWLFCAIFDGFNGRDAADFLAGTLYENVRLYMNMMDSQLSVLSMSTCSATIGADISSHPLQYFLEDNDFDVQFSSMSLMSSDINGKGVAYTSKEEIQPDSCRHYVLCCLERALAQAECDFLHMVEQEMDDRPDLVSIGSCVLVVLLYGQDLYILNLGDSRAILATAAGHCTENIECLNAIQLNEIHSVDNEAERTRILSEHLDDPKTIVAGKVKGKLKLTRAFGVGYLKKKNMNEALLGILKVPNLSSPPYVSIQPSLCMHRVSKGDNFVIAASDGLFDFFTNEEAVELVHSFVRNSPSGDPARFLIKQLVSRAAERAGLSMEELMSIPAGVRRKFHDDVSVIVVLLGHDPQTSTASTNQQALRV